MSEEGVESSLIEGETLDRESLQSSIKKHFGVQAKHNPNKRNETSMANLLCQVYETYDQPLTHEMLWNWHSMLFSEPANISDLGKYRTHEEPMQIVSNRYSSRRVFFEAPPSKRVYDEMTKFINWYNSSNQPESILGKASTTHVYFESIHPFEDGNGRIGRVLTEKFLSQAIKRPILMSISTILEKEKKKYYSALEKCNHTLEINLWVEFFSQAILLAHKGSMNLLYFLIAKSKMLTDLSDRINSRQTKVLLRMFDEGPNGFKGGLSAENYISITKASRATATRDLLDLVEKGALVKTGELRYTRYFLNISDSSRNN